MTVITKITPEMWREKELMFSFTMLTHTILLADDEIDSPLPPSPPHPPTPKEGELSVM